MRPHPQTLLFPLAVGATLTLLLLAGGCGGATPTDAGAVPTAATTSTEAPTPSPSEPTDPSAPTPSSDPAPTTAPTAPPEPRTVALYYLRPAPGENLTDPFIAPVARTIDGAVAVGRSTLEALLDGPTPDEQAAGFASSIPEDTLLLDLHIEDGLATVDLSGNYEAGGGTLSMTARLAEVVFTLTQFPTVDEVTFRLDGQPVTVFSGEGLILDGPVSREDYRSVMPGIFVDEPAWGSVVGHTVTLSGEAAVFEAVFQVELLAPDGSTVVAPIVVLTDNGVGWGRYETTVTVPADTEGSLTLRVFTESAEDGREIHSLDVPITVAG